MVSQNVYRNACLVALSLCSGFAQAQGGLEKLVASTEAVLVAGGFQFTEGPVSDGAGNLYFSDIPAATIYKFSADARLSVFKRPSGNSNGLRLAPDGRLLACEHGGRRVSSIDLETGESQTVVDRYDGKRFNSPNDLWVDPDGGIYFTDPRYGAQDDRDIDGFYVYYKPVDSDAAILIEDDLVKPNGIIGDPKSDKLYITDNGGGKTYVYKRGEDGRLSNRQLFAEYGGDGMTLDEMGNLYITVDAVRVFSPEGEELGAITSAERPANVTFGGVDGKTLFITARTGLYAARMKVTGQ